MADDGSVIRSVVIEVLQRNGAEVSEQPDRVNMYLIVKGGLEIIEIPEICGRRLVHYLSRNLRPQFTTSIIR
jgi:hypothetical protein